ncbi:MAG: hypothetical protein EBZ47_03140 [Chlamydiae bacterium]|nr:hypothetical protein [Chlamydiota bacterium]
MSVPPSGQGSFLDRIAGVAGDLWTQNITNPITTLTGTVSNLAQETLQSAGKLSGQAVGTFADGLLDGVQQKDSLLSEGGMKEKIWNYIHSALKSGCVQQLEAVFQRELLVWKEDLELKITIENIIQALKGWSTNHQSLTELQKSVADILDGGDENSPVLLSLHGFLSVKLPIANDSTPSLPIRNEILDNLPPSLDQAPTPNFQSVLQIETERLIINATGLTALQAACYLSGLAIEEKDQADIMRKEGSMLTPTDISSHFRSYVNNQNIPFYRRWIATSTFAIASLFTRSVLTRFLNGLKDKIITSVDSSDEMMRKQHDSIIYEANAFLNILKGSLLRIQNPKVMTDHPDALIDKDLSRKECNKGFTKQTLYTSFGDEAVYKIMPQLGWAEGWRRASTRINETIESGTLTYPALCKFQLILRNLISPVVRVAEGIGNFCLSRLLVFILRRSKTVEQIVETSMNKINQNGYTHALNEIIYNLLEQIQEQLEQPQIVSSTSPISNVKHLSSLVKNVYDVLEQHDSLNRAGNPSNLIRTLRNTFYGVTIDWSAQAIARLLDQSIHIFRSPENIHERLANIIMSINDSIESDEKPTIEEMQELEHRISSLSGRIIRKTLHQVIDDTLKNPSPSKQNHFNQHINKLKDVMQELVTNSRTSQIEHIPDRIRHCLKELKKLEESCKYSQEIASEFPLYDRKYALPFTQSIRELQIRVKQGNLAEINSLLDAIDRQIQQTRHVKQLNIHPFASLQEGLASTAKELASTASKQIFDEAWDLAKKPHVWRYGLVHRTMLRFVAP